MSEQDTPDFDAFENMSDDDFLNLESPPPADDLMGQGPGSTLEDQLNAEPVAASEDAEEEAEEIEAEETAEADTSDEPDQTDESDEAGTVPETAQEEEPAVAGSESKQTTPNQSNEAPPEPVNYEAAYNQIMAPFKANGRDFKVNSPDEAVRLMQMGANYTKKMQALKPNMRLMRMLENNNLLSEEKLSFLIDLDRKDPGAIQKLLHDGQIDPMDLSTSEPPAYRPGNHAVSDQEMSFHDTLGDVMSNPVGRETVSMINREWDQASKDALYKEPEILAIITEQRANGIFDRISTEIERQQLLGTLSTNTPFIQAYQQVGDMLHQQGLLIPNAPSAQTAPNQMQPGNTNPRVLERRTASPKKSVTNTAAARAASPARASQKSPPKEFDPFEMSDEEIMAITSIKG